MNLFSKKKKVIKYSYLLNCLYLLILFQKSNQLYDHILPLLSSKTLYMLSIYITILLFLTWKDDNIIVFFLIIHKCLMICFRTLPSPFSTFALNILVKYCSLCFAFLLLLIYFKSSPRKSCQQLFHGCDISLA